MENKLSRKRLMEFTRQIILAAKKYEEKKEARPELFIQRTFPGSVPIILAAPAPAAAHPITIEVSAPKKPEIIPVAAPEEIFDIGKITKFAIDRMIDHIECPGPNNPVKIKKENYTFTTDIRLSEDEIREIIEKFSKASGVPISPIFKADARNFSITAIMSKTGSRFLIARKR